MTSETNGLYDELGDEVAARFLTEEDRESRERKNSDLFVENMIKDQLEDFNAGVISRTLTASQADTVYESKLRRKQLVLNHTAAASSSRTNASNKQPTWRVLDKKLIRAQEKREKKLLEIPKSERIYELYIPMAELWRNYANELMKDAGYVMMLLVWPNRQLTVPFL